MVPGTCGEQLSINQDRRRKLGQARTSLALLLVLMAGCFLYSKTAVAQSNNLDGFAQCLAEAGMRPTATR